MRVLAGCIAALLLLLLAAGAWLLLFSAAPAPPPAPRPGPQEPAVAPVRPPPPMERETPAPAPLPAAEPEAPPEQPAPPEATAGLTISGRVTFPDGRPAPEVDLHAARSSARTDESGNYVLEDLPRGEVEVRSFALGQKPRVMAGSAGVDFIVENHIVRVRVEDEEGGPVPDAFHSFEVFQGEDLYFWSSGGSGGREVLSAGAPPGARIQLSCRAEGFMNGVLERTMEGEPALHDLVLVMKRPGPTGTLVVRVRSDADSFPPSAVVRLADRTGAVIPGLGWNRLELKEGTGLLEDVPEGSFRATVLTAHGIEREDYGLPVEKEVRVEAGGESYLDALVKSGGRLTVVVRDGAGKLVPAEELELLDEAGKTVDIQFGNEIQDGMRFGPGLPEPAHGDRPLRPGTYLLRHFSYEGNAKKVVAEKHVVVPWRETVEVEIHLTE